MRPVVVCTLASGSEAPLLARAGEIGLAEVRLGHDPQGRPVAWADGAPVPVSISHCGPVGALALSRSGRVGVDLVDPGAPLATGALLELAAPPERLWLASLPEPLRRRRLFQLWACREALLKALGLGLAVDPAELELGPAGDGLRVLRAPGSAAGWNLDLRDADGLILALAWADGPVDPGTRPRIRP